MDEAELLGEGDDGPAVVMTKEQEDELLNGDDDQLMTTPSSSTAVEQSPAVGTSEDELAHEESNESNEASDNNNTAVGTTETDDVPSSTNNVCGESLSAGSPRHSPSVSSSSLIHSLGQLRKMFKADKAIRMKQDEARLSRMNKRITRALEMSDKHSKMLVACRGELAKLDDALQKVQSYLNTMSGGRFKQEPMAVGGQRLSFSPKCEPGTSSASFQQPLPPQARNGRANAANGRLSQLQQQRQQQQQMAAAARMGRGGGRGWRRGGAAPAPAGLQQTRKPTLPMHPVHTPPVQTREVKSDSPMHAAAAPLPRPSAFQLPLSTIKNSVTPDVRQHPVATPRGSGSSAHEQRMAEHARMLQDNEARLRQASQSNGSGLAHSHSPAAGSMASAMLSVAATSSGGASTRNSSPLMQQPNGRKRSLASSVSDDKPPARPSPLAQMTPKSQREMLNRLLLQEKQAQTAIIVQLQPEPRDPDRTFDVPDNVVDMGRKIVIDHPSFQLTRPYRRPSVQIPPDTQHVKCDRRAPKVVLHTNYTDYSVSGMLNGNVNFQAPDDWLENSARICLFYWVGTQNSGKWERSQFGSMDLKGDPADTRRGTLRFVIKMGKAYLNPDAQNRPNLMVRDEHIGIVAVACAADGTRIRGDETEFDFATLQRVEEKRARQARITQLTGQLKEAEGGGGGGVATTPHNQQSMMQKRRPPQQHQPMRSFRMVGGGDDDDIAVI